ncbi:MAG: thioredoxin [Planctomycetia bacterium]|nr:thioredoxin [Planctomycetia bacterium]
MAKKQQYIAASGLTVGVLILAGTLLRDPSKASSGSQDAAASSTTSEQQHNAHQENYVTSGSRIESATTATFDARVLRWPTPVLVDFYADWCGPCQIQGQILEELIAEDDNATVVKVNVDMNTELAERFGVQALPTLLIFRDGRNVARHVGLATKEQIKVALRGD